MDRKFIIQLEISWIIEIKNTFDNSSKDDLVLKSSLLNKSREELETVSDVELLNITKERIKGKFTVKRETVFENPDKSAEECVNEYLSTDYFQSPPSSFEEFVIENIKVIEERSEIIINREGWDFEV